VTGQDAGTTSTEGARFFFEVFAGTRAS